MAGRLKPKPHRLPPEVDFAIIGGGFTGLAAAAWLRRLAPEKTVAVLEAAQLGAGASVAPAVLPWQRLLSATCPAWEMCSKVSLAACKNSRSTAK
jgi:glycine/D-amino acid oxidase-like deaminating enzyme